MRALRWLDLAVLALALPIFLAAGLPLYGWGMIAVTWVALRALHDLLGRRAQATEDPRRATLVLALGMMARVWLLAFVIFGAGAIDREAGLSAAVLSIALVTAYLIALLTRGPFDTPGMTR